MDNSVGAQIAPRVILDCQQTDFATLTTVTSGALTSTGVVNDRAPMTQRYCRNLNSAAACI